MTDIVTKLTNYFHVFDGTSKSLLDHRDVIDDVIDDHIVVRTPEGDIFHPQYIERIRQLLDSGAKVEILQMKIHELGVEYTVRMEVPGKEPIELHAVGVADHGKIIRVEPITNADAYNCLFGNPDVSE